MSQNTGYIYSLWTGHFLCMEAEFGVNPDSRVKDLYWAKTKAGKLLWVSNIPGVVYNAMVWLEDRDDDRAARILIDHQNQQIALLEEKILNHKYKIETLQLGVKEDLR